MKNVYKWYTELKGYKKILAGFVLNWIYWGFVYLLIYYVITAGEEQTRSIKDYLISVTIGAVLWTLLYNINYSKLYKKPRRDKNVQVSDTTNDEKSF